MNTRLDVESVCRLASSLNSNSEAKSLDDLFEGWAEREAHVERQKSQIMHYVDAVLHGHMLEIRKVKGVTFKTRDPRVWMSCAKHQAVMYDDGVQFESDSGATLFGWDSIESIIV